MPRPMPASRRRWIATLIISGFAFAVAGAAFVGWRYARESSPHPGPIVLISVAGLDPGALAELDDGDNPQSPIGVLADDAVVFERAYTHSPLTLPAVASILVGQLPFEHGVRDDAGFSLADTSRSLAELLRNRGFDTGGAVSSFVLRKESGIGQGFGFFDANIPESPPDETDATEREGLETTDAAANWLESQRGYRYFLFLEVDNEAAQTAVARLVATLKERELYDQATIVLTADRGAASTGLTLDEASLRVPLLVKQPNREGAGRHLDTPVQHIDILPTILDLVRAPVPSGLPGRSLRALLDGDTDALPPGQLFYAESLAAQYRFGASGVVSLADSTHRYVRGSDERLTAISPSPDGQDLADSPAEMARLRDELDRLLAGHPDGSPAPIAPVDEERFAALGYFGGPPLVGLTPVPMAAEDQAAVNLLHRSAGALAAEREYAAAVTRLRQIARTYPGLALIQYQAGVLLSSAGRHAEAERALRAAAAIELDSPEIQASLAEVFLRAGRKEEASRHAALAVALAEHTRGSARARAYRVAAAAALANDDRESAQRYAADAEREDPSVPWVRFFTAQEQRADQQDEEALASLRTVVSAVDEHGRSIERLQWYLGETLARLGRDDEAEEAFRRELRAFPRSVEAYSSLAALYHRMGLSSAVQETLDALLIALPTPESYDAAARLWTAIGEPRRAAALRTDATRRFRDDPSLALFQRRR